MFDREEVEAVAVGLQLVTWTGDQDLQVATRRVAAEVAAVLPELRAVELDDGRFVVSGFGAPTAADMGMLRSAVRNHRRLALVYRDEREQLKTRPNTLRTWMSALSSPAPTICRSSLNMPAVMRESCGPTPICSSRLWISQGD